MYTIKRMPEFDAWLGGLKDALTRKRLGLRLRKAQMGNLGDCKPVGMAFGRCANFLALVSRQRSSK